MPACRARRPRRSEPKLSNAARRSACQCRRDAGWPGKRGPHRALAARFRPSHHAPPSWPFARGGSARVSRPPGRQPSSSCPMRQHSCHSAAACSAAGAPADGAGRRTAAAASAPLLAHAPAGPMPGCRSPPVAIAAQVAGVRARLATAERSRARPRGAPGRQCKAVTTTRSTSLWSLEWQSQTGVTQCWQILVLKWHGSTSTLLGYNLVLHMGQLYSGQTQNFTGSVGAGENPSASAGG